MTLEEIIADPEKARQRIAELETALVVIQVMEPHPGPATVVRQFTATPTMPTRPGARRVTLTPEEREMARIIFPKTSPNDPDPEILFAQRKLALEDKAIARDIAEAKARDQAEVNKFLAERVTHHLDGNAQNNSPENLIYVVQPSRREA